MTTPMTTSCYNFHFHQKHNNKCVTSTKNTTTTITSTREIASTLLLSSVVKKRKLRCRLLYSYWSSFAQPPPYQLRRELFSRTLATTTSATTTARRDEDDKEEDGMEKLHHHDDISIREYQNLWSSPPSSGRSSSLSSLYYLETIDDDLPLDRQSRLVLELLQTMYQVGLIMTLDRVTTERCNAMIHRLKTTTNSDYTKSVVEGPGTHKNNPDFAVWPDEYDQVTSKDETKDEATTKSPSSIMSTSSLSLSPKNYWSRCERARAILESMELFQPLQESHSGQLPVALPVPNHETYFQVLSMYASKHLRGLVLQQHHQQQSPPLLAQSIVQRMEKSQKLALQPSAMHWNHVISAFANSNRPQRPLEAATLLYKLDTKKLTDESSFSHVLRCCCVDSGEDLQRHTQTGSNRSPKFWQQQNQQRQQEKFVETALAVAQRVWKGLTQHHQHSQQQKPVFVEPRRNDHLSDLLDTTTTNDLKDANADGEIRFQSHHFVHMIRVARNFANLSLDGDTINQRQAEWVKRYLQECIEHQKVNLPVLLEVILQAKEMAKRSSQEDCNELDWIVQLLGMEKGMNRAALEGSLERLKDKREQAVSRSPGRIAKGLLRHCPPGWTAKADN